MKQQNAPQIGDCLRCTNDQSLALVIEPIYDESYILIKFLTKNKYFNQYSHLTILIHKSEVGKAWKVISD